MNKLKIEFTVEELQILDQALINLPYKLSAPIIYNINSQLKDLSEHKASLEQPFSVEE